MISTDTKSIYKRRITCAICHNQEFEIILDYGNVPLAGVFPKEIDKNKIILYPLKLLFCRTCGLIQTNSSISAESLFKNYRYSSSISLQTHFNEYALILKQRFKLTHLSNVLEIGSNDGVLLQPLQSLGIPSTGFDPSENISSIAIKKGCSVIVDYFNIENAKKYLVQESYDLITASNCFAHIDDIHSVVQGIYYALRLGAYFIIEVHYGKNIIKGLQYDNVYHEHQYYYTLHSLKYLFDQYDMSIIDVEETAIHSGSIRVTVQKIKGRISDCVLIKMNEEKKLNLTSFEGYLDFKNLVIEHKKKLIHILSQLKNESKKIAAFGASGRANILSYFCDIGPSDVTYIIDESPERYDRYINGIPIYSLDKLEKDVDILLVFSWNYSRSIIKKLNKNFNFSYLIPFPVPKIVRTVDELDHSVETL